MNGRSAIACMGLIVACGGGGGPDVGTPDAGAVDAPMNDASDDAGAVDAPTNDAGGDGGVWTPPKNCDATGVDVYTPPAGIPPFTEADRGRVLACGRGDPIPASLSDARARERGYAGPALTHDATVTRVLYQSERRNGAPGFASGMLVLPASGASDAPLVVFVAGTTGLGDPCAPSRLGERRFNDFERAFYVLVGSGVAVFVPDLIGLGTPGTLAYLEPVDAAHSVLDGARAALRIAPEGALSGAILIAGHSAGGHAALAAQSLQRSYAPELDVRAVAGIAPAWFDTTQFALLLYFENYDVTHPSDGWNVVYAGMYFVGHTAAFEGEERAYDPIAAGIRDRVRTIYETQCLENPGADDLRTQIAAVAPRLRDLFDEPWRRSVSDCYLGIACDERGSAWQMRMAMDRPALDPEGPRVFFHHGDADMRIALSTMLCPIADAMAADPRTVACIYAGGTHNDLPGRVAPWLVDYAAAIAAGGDAPACPDPTPLPECMR